MKSTAELWNAYQDRLRRSIASRVGNDADVQDILQNVFTKVHEGLAEVRDEGKLEAWLFQVARRATIDHFREGAARRRPLPAPKTAEEPPASEAAAEIASWLRPMMEGLPAADREVLELAELRGMEQKDVALQLGLSLSGAKSRVQRARRRLKETLLDCCHVDLDRRGNAVAYTPRRPSCSCDSCR